MVVSEKAMGISESLSDHLIISIKLALKTSQAGNSRIHCGMTIDEKVFAEYDKVSRIR